MDQLERLNTSFDASFKKLFIVRGSHLYAHLLHFSFSLSLIGHDGFTFCFFLAVNKYQNVTNEAKEDPPIRFRIDHLFVSLSFAVKFRLHKEEVTINLSPVFAYLHSQESFILYEDGKFCLSFKMASPIAIAHSGLFAEWQSCIWRFILFMRSPAACLRPSVILNFYWKTFMKMNFQPNRHNKNRSKTP